MNSAIPLDMKGFFYPQNFKTYERYSANNDSLLYHNQPSQYFFRGYLKFIKLCDVRIYITVIKSHY